MHRVLIPLFRGGHIHIPIHVLLPCAGGAVAFMRPVMGALGPAEILQDESSIQSGAWRSNNQQQEDGVISRTSDTIKARAKEAARHRQGDRGRALCMRGTLPSSQCRLCDTSYQERRGVSWDGYIDVRANRDSVPDKMCSAEVVVRHRSGRGAQGRAVRFHLPTLDRPQAK